MIIKQIVIKSIDISKISFVFLVQLSTFFIV